MNNRSERIKLHIPAGNLDCLKTAVDAGADVVYFGLNGPTNLRNFAGINFSLNDAAAGIAYAKARGKSALITINSFPQYSQIAACYAAIDLARELSANGVIVSDLSLLAYARQKYPELKIYLSVQAGAADREAINFYSEEFGIECAILPRVVSLAEIEKLAPVVKVKLEVFAFGSLCINYEGRCLFSSYVTGESTNTIGTCSTPKFLTFERGEELIAKMHGIAINKFAPEELKTDPHFNGGLPEEEISQWGNHFMINRRQICKGRYFNEELKQTDYSFNELVYLNTLAILPQLVAAGVSALKIEGRQRNQEYVRQTTGIFKEAISLYYENPEKYQSFLSQKEQACQDLFPQISPTFACYQPK